jgi:hypothetical protein
MVIVNEARASSTEPTNSKLTPAGQWDILLYWMSDTGEGSWDQFRNTVVEIGGTQNREVTRVQRALRISLSDFAHADFFVDGSARWKILRPVVAGLMAPAGAALLIGARTPSLVLALKEAAGRNEVAIICESADDSPAVIRLEGATSNLNACAATVGVDYLNDYSLWLAANLVPIPALLERPRCDAQDVPINWTARSFDLPSRMWVNGLLPQCACEFKPRNGRPRYFVSDKRRRLIDVGGRRNALFAAAYMQRIPLGTYDSTTRKISVPISTPFPEEYARVACLCSGRHAYVTQGRVVYEDVPGDVAAVLLVSLGQSCAVTAIGMQSGDKNG